MSKPSRFAERRSRFVDEYLVDLNATQAAIRAGYSERTANEQACDLLARPDVRAMVAERQAKRLAKTELTAAEVMQEIARRVKLDPALCFDAAGNLLHIKDMPLEVRMCVESIEVIKRNLVGGDGHTDTIYKVKFWPKKDAVEMGAKHHKLLTEVIEVRDVAALLKLLDEGRQRAASRNKAIDAG